MSLQAELLTTKIRRCTAGLVPISLVLAERVRFDKNE